MTFHTIKIHHYKKNPTKDSWSNTDSGLIQEVISCNVNQQIGDKADSFDISFNNYDKDNLFGQLNVDDRVSIMMSIDGVDTSLMDGSINNIKQENGVDNNFITLSGLNRFEKLLNASVPTERGKKTASDWIKFILNQVNEWNKWSGRFITWKSDNDTTTVPIEYSKGYTPAFQLIEELSQPDINMSGKEFYYYLDEYNQFVFKQKSSTPNSTITYPNNVDKTTTEKGMFEIVNFVIMNCGRDAYDKYSILIMGYNHKSVVENGWKVKFMTDTSKRTEIRDNEAKQGGFAEGSNFPSSYSGGYKCKYIKDVDDDGNLLTTHPIVNSDAEFNTAFRKHVKAEMQIKLDLSLESFGDATFKVRMDVPEDADYTPAFVYKLVNAWNNWGSSPYTGPPDMRLFTQHYEFSPTTGWKTSLEINEDPLKINTP